MKYFLRCDWSINKSDWLYLIPTLKCFAHNEYFEVELNVLLLSIYWCFSIRNYDKDES